MQATLTFLGSGTSMGVPTLGCDCAVCLSAVSPAPGQPAPSPRNRRTRPSVLIAWEGHNVVIDTGPDFHAQAIAAGIHRLDAVLYTHGHADHVLGMDDLRPLSFHNTGNLPLYADEQTALTIERIFNYTFSSEHSYPTSARVALHRIPATPGAEVVLFGARFLRVPVTHGRQTISGFRFGSAAYLTDLSDLDPGGPSPAQRPRPPHPRRPAPRAPPHPLATSLTPSPWSSSCTPPRLLHPHLPRPRPRLHQRLAAAPHPPGLRRPAAHLRHRPAYH